MSIIQLRKGAILGIVIMELDCRAYPFLMFNCIPLSYEVTHVNGNGSVSRRYRDFVKLHHTLLCHFPGAFVPPIPQKKIRGRFCEIFVATRMRGLQHFLEEVLKSPDFQGLNYVVAFWEQPDPREWTALATTGEQ